VVLAKLPGWVIDDATSVRREVEAFERATSTERWAATLLCARDALWAVRLGHDPGRVLDFEDRLAPATERAFERLRARTRRDRGGS